MLENLGAWKLFGGILALGNLVLFNHRTETTLRIPCSSVLGFGGHPRIGNLGAGKPWCSKTLVLENALVRFLDF